MPTAAAFNLTSGRVAIVSATILETGGARGDVVLEDGTSCGWPGQSSKHVAFSPDGNLVLTVSMLFSPYMKIWDAYTGVNLWSLEGHDSEQCRIHTACFSPCGKYIASASEDGAVRLWRTRDGSCIATLSGHDSAVFHVVFSPNGKTLVSASSDGSVLIRKMCDVLPIDERDP